MTYRTGSITSPGPADVLLALLDTDLLATGYVKVETDLVVGGVNWNVYKSPGASNFFGADWFLALGKAAVTNADTVYACTMESWDTVTKAGRRFPPAAGATLIPVSGYVNPQGPFSLPCGFLLSHQFPINGFTYSYSVLIDRVVIAAWVGTSDTGARFGWYVGLYDSFYSIEDDPFPLCICRIGRTAQSSTPTTGFGATSREPMTTTANATNFAITYGASGTMIHKWNPGVYSLYQGGRPWVSRTLIGGRGGSYEAGSGVLLYPRGLFRDLFCGPQQGQYRGSNGDRITWTANGQTYSGVVFAHNTGAVDAGTQPTLIPEY